MSCGGSQVKWLLHSFKKLVYEMLGIVSQSLLLCVCFVARSCRLFHQVRQTILNGGTQPRHANGQNVRRENLRHAGTECVRSNTCVAAKKGVP